MLCQLVGHLDAPLVVAGSGIGLAVDVGEYADDALVLVVETEIAAVLQLVVAAGVEGELPVAAVPYIFPYAAGHVGVLTRFGGVGQ